MNNFTFNCVYIDKYNRFKQVSFAFSVFVIRFHG